MYTIIILCVIIFLLVTTSLLDFFYIAKNDFLRNFSLAKVKPKTLAIMGLLIAISFVLNFLSIPILGTVLQITFFAIPLILAGLMYGPLLGLMTGLIEDGLHSLALNQPFNIGFTLTAGIDGLVPGLIIIFFIALLNKKISIKFYVLTSLACFLIFELILLIILGLNINYIDSIHSLRKAFPNHTKLFIILCFSLFSIFIFIILTGIFFLIIHKKAALPLPIMFICFMVIFLHIAMSSFLLDSLWIHIQYHVPLKVIFVPRLVSAPFDMIIYLIIIPPLVNFVNHHDKDSIISQINRKVETSNYLTKSH